MKEKKSLWKRILKWAGIALLAIVLLAAAFVVYLTVTEYDPPERLALTVDGNTQTVFSGTELTVLSFNTGYSGLGWESDFFMDGGEQVRPKSRAYVQENMEGIAALLQQTEADLYFLQEVDRESKRGYGIDQSAYYPEALQLASAYALNYACAYVPYPLPTIGKVYSGIQTLSAYRLEDAERVKLPSPFSWPVSVANLKRCLLVTRMPIAGSDKEIVLVNLHLEAYDDGEGKLAQTQMLWELLTEEYEKGNYVIAGGDFNQAFPDSLRTWPVPADAAWVPGVLDAELPKGWQYAYDVTTASCRSLQTVYAPDSDAMLYYVIDGFILSPNVALEKVETLDEDFRYSDHNPVKLTVTLR